MMSRILKSRDFGSLIRAPNQCFETTNDSLKFLSFRKQCFESGHRYTVETCSIAEHNATDYGCRRVETHVCGMRENKGVLTLGNLNRARAHLTPKARFV